MRTIPFWRDQIEIAKHELQIIADDFVLARQQALRAMKKFRRMRRLGRGIRNALDELRKAEQQEAKLRRRSEMYAAKIPFYEAQITRLETMTRFQRLRREYTV